MSYQCAEFEQAELWPTAARRCYQVIEKLGRLVLALFDTRDPLGGCANGDVQLGVTQGTRFGEIIQDSLDWVGIQQNTGLFSSRLLETSSFDPGTQLDSYHQQSFGDSSFGTQYNLDETMDLDGLLDFGFDMSLPLMTNAFDSSDLVGQGFQGDFL